MISRGRVAKACDRYEPADKSTQHTSQPSTRIGKCCQPQPPAHCEDAAGYDKSSCNSDENEPKCHELTLNASSYNQFAI